MGASREVPAEEVVSPHLSLTQGIVRDSSQWEYITIIILLGSTNAMVKGIRLKYLAHRGAKLSMLNK